MIPQVTPAMVQARLTAGEDLTLVDVRESWELAICALPQAQHIAMGEIPERWRELPAHKSIVVICRSGQRSQHVAQFLQDKGLPLVENLAGGILAWGRDIDPSLAAY